MVEYSSRWKAYSRTNLYDKVFNICYFTVLKILTWVFSLPDDRSAKIKRLSAGINKEVRAPDFVGIFACCKNFELMKEKILMAPPPPLAYSLFVLESK